MEKIFENESLRFICNSINTGMVDFNDCKQLEIVSRTKPDFVVKVIEIDLMDYVSEMLQKSELLKKSVTHVETTVYDYIVFGKTIDSENKTLLMTISLLELITVSEKLTDEVNSPISSQTNWSLDTKDWDLIINN